jgi:hypothetical protein
MKLSALKIIPLLAALIVMGWSRAYATPYASSITNTGSTISFRLNESADSVKIISNGGATTNDLGARPFGLTVTNLTITGTFYIEVSKGPSLGYLNGVTNQISADTNVLLRFNAPRGVAVNRNPASPYFGRIYVSNADTGSLAAAAPFPARNLVNGDGLFVLNGDFTDALGQGNAARTAGINWRTNLNDTANKPFRIEVGEDNNVYISDYSSPTNFAILNLFVADADLSPSSGTNVFAYDPAIVGRFPSSVIAKGSLGTGNLQIFGVYPDIAYEYDLFGSFSYSVMQRWNVGSGPLPSSVTPVRATDLPVLIADVPSVLSDLDIAPDGKYFLSQNRSDGFESGLFVVDPSKDNDSSGFADVVFTSYDVSVNQLGSTNDLLRQTRAVKVSPDNKVVALIRDDNQIWIIPLTNGLPDLAGRRLMSSGSLTTIGRDISFDAAGNIYTVSSGQGAMKSFSPGYPTRAVTGSDGTFSITRVTGNEIALTLVDINLSEPGANTAQFTVTRSGDLSGPLDVRLAYTGTATFTNDYTGAPTNITFAAGVSTTNITVTALDDTVGEATETIIVTVAPGTNYISKGAFSGTLFIADDGDPASVTISGADTNLYERFPADSGRFVVTRAGAPAGDLNVNLAYSGTAVGGTDYITFTNVVTISNNLFSATNNILVPIDNALLDGNRTIIVSVLPGAGYVLGSTANATFLIRDDETTPNTPVLFSDDFDTDTSANYAVVFGADNNVVDRTVTFNFDYSTRGVSSAPHSTGGTTRGLFATVNKDATTSAAGVNIYANGVSFSNDYVLRFDMYHNFDSAVAGTTEHAIFGLNHSGSRTNRALTGGGLVGGDGVWAAIESDGSASSTARSYALFGSTNQTVAPPFSSLSARAMDTFFTTPPFKGIPAGAPSGQWVDVEISQTNNAASQPVIALKINNVLILTRTNNTAFTSGTLMLGYMDSFASIGSTNNFVIYDNVRVINLTLDRPNIVAVRKNGANIEVDFTAGATDLPGAFTLESSTILPGGFSTDLGSSVSALPTPGLFRAISPNSGGPQRFYRIER